MIIEKDGQRILTVDDWQRLAPPKAAHHWAAGRSAAECAMAWCDPVSGPQVPKEIAGILHSHATFTGATIEWITPEHKTRFDKFKGEPRNADIVAVANGRAGKFAISIEAKADESFGQLVADVLAEGVKKIASDQSTNSIARVQQLAESLLPARSESTKPLGQLRYQLLTATAGAIAFAAEQKAAYALLIIHEFVTNKTTPENRSRNESDLNCFVSRLTSGAVTNLNAGVLVGPIAIPGRPIFEQSVGLYIGKVVRTVKA